MHELVNKRTPFSKLTDLGNGRKRLRISRAPLHYIDKDGKLADIDLTPSLRGGKHLIDKAPYVLQIDPVVPAYRYVSASGQQVEVELVEAGGKPIAMRPPERQRHLFAWPQVAPDTDYMIRPLRWGCSTYMKVASAQAPRTWTWRVRGDYGLLQPLTGTDSSGKRLELVQKFDGEYLTLQWTGRATSRALLRDAKAGAWTTDLTYPLLIDPTVNEVIAAGGDDVFSTWNSGGTNFYAFAGGLANLIAGRYTGGGYDDRDYAGLRFQTVAVPQAATITSATLVLDVISATTPDINIFGNDVDDAAAFADPGNRVKEMTKTSAVTNTTSTATGVQNFTVTSIVQEIVDRAGWASGNDMAFGLFNNSGSDIHQLSVAALEHATLQEAHLDIDYADAGGATRVTGDGLTHSRLLRSRHIRV